MSNNTGDSPGDPDWKWFPNMKTGWSLDVVNLLVVIGESSIAEHAQAITASLPGMLPRILPAPQALLKPSRPTRMPETHARMTGVYSGLTLDTVGFFANIITPLDNLPPFSFNVLDIKHSDLVAERGPKPAVVQGRFQTTVDRISRVIDRLRGTKKKMMKHLVDDAEGQNGTGEPYGQQKAFSPHQNEESDPAATSINGTTSSRDPRRQTTVQFADKTTGDDIHPVMRLRRRSTARERAQDLLTSPTTAVRGSRPAVPAKLFSPVHILSIFSCILSIAIITTAIVKQDGTAILAITLISLASTVVGCASFWQPILMKRKHTNEVPKGDVLIRTREGAFVLVRCSEEVARELYSGTEECEYYISGNAYRALMALGTTLLMISVVLLGNCTWELKVFIGASYIVLNGLYWGLGMIPRSYFWDLSRYEWKDATPPDASSAHKITDVDDEREGHPSFTRTLWYAIRETKLTGWVERSGAAPSTESWKKWLREAEAAAKAGKRDWPAIERKNCILKEQTRNGEVFDHAAQHAPATEVRAPRESGNNRWTKDGIF
ncbi:hypothetical protein QQS21_010290 [Conoideocrella luteorostrata]|uniref:Uncharacterized protein n=1 Tax=Conoideocrella luteorostrata TaxID=1105319 RepID=A0AAJ0FUB8_9HYPO|nr:hypothetical protein QQS21_010290 [Conoideocrella luteorostrata]